MNRPFPADDDRARNTPHVASDPPVFRVALIDLTTSQIVISIGEPPVTEDVVDRPLASAGAAWATPVAQVCARGPLRRRLAQTRAHHRGDGPTCP